jgi:hypothetical protein
MLNAMLSWNNTIVPPSAEIPEGVPSAQALRVVNSPVIPPGYLCLTNTVSSAALAVLNFCRILGKLKSY